MIDRSLLASLIGCVAFGSAIALEFGPSAQQEPVTPAAAARVQPPPSPRAKAAPVEDLVAGAAARPLFSPSRRPPEKGSPTAAGDPELNDVRLTGIVVEPDRHLAIFAIAGGKPLVRAEGEAVKEWRLDSISATEVALSGPGGLRTMAPKSDPNLVRPPPPVRPAPAAAPSGTGHPAPQPGKPAAAAAAQPQPIANPLAGRVPNPIPLRPAGAAKPSR